MNLAMAQPLRADTPSGLEAWVQRMASGGARYRAGRERRRACGFCFEAGTLSRARQRLRFRRRSCTGEGDAWDMMRDSHRDVVFRAVRYRPPSGGLFVIRMAIRLVQADPFSVSRFSSEASLLQLPSLILIAGIAVSFVFSRMLAGRIEQLKDFSRRVASGNFRPVQFAGPRDEIADLADALNETAARLRRHDSISERRTQSFDAILRSMVEGVGVY